MTRLERKKREPKKATKSSSIRKKLTQNNEGCYSAILLIYFIVLYRHHIQLQYCVNNRYSHRYRTIDLLDSVVYSLSTVLFTLQTVPTKPVAYLTLFKVSVVDSDLFSLRIRRASREQHFLCSVKLLLIEKEEVICT